MDVTSSHSEWRRPRFKCAARSKAPTESLSAGSGQPLPSGLHHTERFVAAGWGWMGLFECTSDDLVEECNESYKRNDDAGAASRNSGTEERSQPSFLNTTQPVGCQFVLICSCTSSATTLCRTKKTESWLVGVQVVVCHDSRQSHDKNDSTAAYLMTILKN